MATITRLTDPTIRRLRDAVILLADCEDEAVVNHTLSQVAVDELDGAVELYADLTERMRRLRAARDAGGER
jgi:hypothetical protein